MRSLSRPEGCVSDLAFDELHAGELEASARLALEAHLASCARCRERRQDLSRERAALLDAAPDLASLARGRATAPATRSRPRRRAVIAIGTMLAAAAAVLLAVLPDSATQQSSTRSKGAPRLGMVIKRGERTFRAESGVRVRAGDLVRFTYSSDGARHLAVLGLDTRKAQIYFPTAASAGGRALRVHAGSDTALDFSVELDATPGDEQIYGLFCDEPIALEPVRADLERRRALHDLAGCAIDQMVLHKESTP
jgi:plastocyanin